MSPLVRQLRLYIAIRVVAIVSVLLPYALWQLSHTETPSAQVVYLLGGATFFATLVYIALLRLLRRNPTVQAYVQFIGDLILITGLVYFLGGAASPFSLLYLIVISVASTLLLATRKECRAFLAES